MPSYVAVATRVADDTVYGGPGDDESSMSEGTCPDVLTFHGGLGRDHLR